MQLRVASLVLRGAILLVAAMLTLVATVAIAPRPLIETWCGAALTDCVVRLAASKGISLALSDSRIDGWFTLRTVLPSARLRMSKVEARFALGEAKAAEVAVKIVPRWGGLALVVEWQKVELAVGSGIRIDRIDGELLLPSAEVRLESILSVEDRPLRMSIRPGSAACGGGAGTSGAVGTDSVLALWDAAGSEEIASLSYPMMLRRWLRPGGEGKVCLNAIAPAKLAGLVAAATGRPVTLPHGLEERLTMVGMVKWLGSPPRELDFTVGDWSVQTGECRLEGTLTWRSRPDPDLHGDMRRLDLECMERQRAAREIRWRDPLSLKAQCEPLRDSYDFLTRERPPVPVRLTIDELEWRNRAVRDLKVAFVPKGDAWQVTANASLPDDATFTLDLSQQRGEPRQLAGQVRVTAPALQKTLAWLELDGSNSPLDQVARGSLSAVVTWRERHLEMTSSLFSPPA